MVDLPEKHEGRIARWRRTANEKTRDWLNDHTPEGYQLAGVYFGDIATATPNFRTIGGIAGIGLVPAGMTLRHLAQGQSLGEAIVSTAIFLIAGTMYMGATGLSLAAGSFIGYCAGAHMDRRLGLYESNDTYWNEAYAGLVGLTVRAQLATPDVLNTFAPESIAHEAAGIPHDSETLLAEIRAYKRARTIAAGEE